MSLLALLFIPALLFGCKDNKGTKGPTGPGVAVTGTASNGQATASLNFNPNTVAPGGNAGITLLLTTISGAPIEGQSVQWSTTGGTLATVSGKTDAAGKAVNNISIEATFTGSEVTVAAVVANLSVSGKLFVGVPGQIAIVPAGPLTLAPGDTQVLNCVGGVDPVQWEASGGTVNPRIERSTTFTAGTQTGTFFVKCVDVANNSASVEINITLTAGGLTITPGSATLSPGQAQTFQASGGRPPYVSWSFPSAAGTLSATSGPTTTLTAGTVPADAEFNLVVTDSSGATATAKVSIKAPPKLQLLPPDVTRTFGATGAVPGSCGSVTFTVTFTVTGGVPPYTFSATFGTFSSSTLSAAGTVTYTFPATTLTGGTTRTETITVLDSAGTPDTSTVKVECTATTS